MDERKSRIVDKIGTIKVTATLDTIDLHNIVGSVFKHLQILILQISLSHISIFNFLRQSLDLYNDALN